MKSSKSNLSNKSKNAWASVAVMRGAFLTNATGPGTFIRQAKIEFRGTKDSAAAYAKYCKGYGTLTADFDVFEKGYDAIEKIYSNERKWILKPDTKEIKRRFDFDLGKKRPSSFEDDLYQEAWLAYLQAESNKDVPTVEDHLKEWRIRDKYISWSGRTYSPSWFPPAPREDGRVGYIVRSKAGFVLTRGDFRSDIDRDRLKCYENNDKYKIEYYFDNGWPGTGSPEDGGIYLYRRPYTDSISKKACTNPNCDPLSQDLQLTPAYYMVGDVCWDCHLDKGIDPLEVSVAWVSLLCAAFSGGLLTHDQAIAYFHVLSSYRAGFDYQIAALLRTKRPAATRLLGRIEKKLSEFSKNNGKNVTSALHNNRGGQASEAYRLYN